MEGRREEYLASCTTKAQAHLAHVEDVQQAETSLDILDELVLMQDFAAMSLNIENDINYTTYSSATSVILMHNKNIEPLALATLPI
jgi:hypothetical protein